MPGPRRAPRALAATAALLLPLTACGGGGDSPAGAEGGKEAKGGDGFPYTVTNCGVKTTFEQAPERAVTMNQHVTEVMLALGLEDRMAGTAFLDDKILPEYRAAYDRIEVVADEYPSYEKLIATSPDFVYGGYASAFDKGSGASARPWPRTASPPASTSRAARTDPWASRSCARNCARWRGRSACPSAPRSS